MLRRCGIDPPKWHDVGGIILEHIERFPQDTHDALRECAKISKALRKERELAFYGDIDFIPTEEYGADDAAKVIDQARFVVDLAGRIVASRPA